jgi:hypothetical protein
MKLRKEGKSISYSICMVLNLATSVVTSEEAIT